MQRPLRRPTTPNAAARGACKANTMHNGGSQASPRPATPSSLPLLTWKGVLNLDSWVEDRKNTSHAPLLAVLAGRNTKIPLSPTLAISILPGVAHTHTHTPIMTGTWVTFRVRVQACGERESKVEVESEGGRGTSLSPALLHTIPTPFYADRLQQSVTRVGCVYLRQGETWIPGL